MLILSLLRHAKSSWSDPDLDDHDRPLAKRGVKAAPLVARHMRREGLFPSLVLSSGAVRTRATLALVLAELGGSTPEVRYDDALYLASPETIMGLIREVPAKASAPFERGPHSHVLVVGHNPGLHALALELAGTGDRKLLSALAMEFPTTALAVLSFGTENWADVKPAMGKLEHFVTPRRLAS